MPVPNLKTCDVFYIVRFPFDQLGRPITLDPCRFPSRLTDFSITKLLKQNYKIGTLAGRKWESCLQI